MCVCACVSVHAHAYLLVPLSPKFPLPAFLKHVHASVHTRTSSTLSYARTSTYTSTPNLDTHAPTHPLTHERQYANTSLHTRFKHPPTHPHTHAVTGRPCVCNGMGPDVDAPGHGRERGRYQSLGRPEGKPFCCCCYVSTALFWLLLCGRSILLRTWSALGDAWILKYRNTRARIHKRFGVYRSTHTGTHKQA